MSFLISVVYVLLIVLRMTANVGACAVAGIGGLGNAAKRNAKTDQLRPVPRHNVNKETESYEDTEPGHCTSILLAAGRLLCTLSYSNEL